MASEMLDTTIADGGVATAAAKPARRAIGSIQVMRGFAAIAVAIYHTQLILGQPEYGGLRVGGALASKGWAGVNFFFVLSGFIIMYAHVGDLGRPARLARYAWRRVARIYPIYWAALTAYVAAGLAGIGHPDFRVTWGDFLSAYTLVKFVPDPSLPIKVAWTLLYEVTFYAMFALLILNRRVGIAAFALWVVAIIGSALFVAPPQPGFLHPWNLYFLIGIGVYFAYRHAPARLGPWLLGAALLSAVALLAGGMVPDRIGDAQTNTVGLLLLAVPFALVLLGGALVERDGDWRAPALLLLLGEASYSIYLIHSPALSVIAGANHKLNHGLVPDGLVFVAAAIAAVVAGVVVHLLVERPLLNGCRALGTRLGVDRRKG